MSRGLPADQYRPVEQFRFRRPERGSGGSPLKRGGGRLSRNQARDTPGGSEAATIAPRLLTGALLLTGLLLVVPLWLTRLPPMSDFPAHAAALFLQMHAAASPILSRLYQIEWAPVPDLASELLVPLYAPLMPVIPATRLFIGIAVLLWVTGPAAVQYALFRRVTVTALGGTLFAYNRNFILGFVNYYFAAGVGFFIIAAWIASAGRPALRPPSSMLAVFLTVLYFLHVLAMAFATFFPSGLRTGEDRRRPER